MLQVGAEALNVRIYSIGLLGLTGGTMLSKSRLRHMQCYSVVKWAEVFGSQGPNTGKKVTCVLV